MIRVSHMARECESVGKLVKKRRKIVRGWKEEKKGKEMERVKGKKKWVDHGKARKIRKTRGWQEERKKKKTMLYAGKKKVRPKLVFWDEREKIKNDYLEKEVKKTKR